jgi:hypothetical protein
MSTVGEIPAAASPEQEPTAATQATDGQDVIIEPDATAVCRLFHFLSYLPIHLGFV